MSVSRKMTLLAFLIAFAMVGSYAAQARAHCQIPCGIYDDHARVHQIREDITTIEKAVTGINELAGKTDAQSQQQLIRWVTNKEKHATKIQRTVADYFLTQVVKPADTADKDAYSKYLLKLADHHAVLVAAMKCKQNATMDAVNALKAAVDKLETYYPKSE